MFVSFYLTLFDPYNIIYDKSETISSLDALKVELAKGVSSGRFIIPYSHYSLICSGEFYECSGNFARLQDYFDAMLESGVSLYVGAHTHSYERNYPYFKNHTFVPIESPYTPNGEFLISVVEGVGGNDNDIVTEMLQKQGYTAKYTVNETGFGVIESTQHQVTYSHFSTKQGFMDAATILKTKTTQQENKLKLRVEDY
jgi:hypothetical protein